MKRETVGNSMSCALAGPFTLRNIRAMPSSRRSKRIPAQHRIMLTVSLEMTWNLVIDVKHIMAMHSSLIAQPRPLGIERTRRRMSKVGVGTSILTFNGAAS